MTDKKQALTDLLSKVEAGGKYETMGHTIMCQKAFPKPSDFDGSREAYAKSAAQQAILVWRNGSLDAAKAMHEAVLPGWGVTFYGGFVPSGKYGIIVSKARYGEPRNQYTGSATNPARAWLIAIIKALIAEETQ